MIPDKLKQGDEIRIIAPARNILGIPEEHIQLAKIHLENLGFKVTFSKNFYQGDIMSSMSVTERLEDLHEAFLDKNVKCVLAAIGGYNSNQLLKYIDYQLIQNNPKILCGFSDITALQNAIFARTGLITYAGPFFITFAMQKGFDYTETYFKKAFMQNESYRITPALSWSDDKWYLDQENRHFETNDWQVVHGGSSSGTAIGGNLSTFRLLCGTQYMPMPKDVVLFIEDDAYTIESDAPEFDRNLQSLIHQPWFDTVRGIVIGRFQKGSNVSDEELKYIIETKAELKHLPILTHVDFGHTHPLFTFPIGGKVFMNADEKYIDVLLDK